jgi:phosphonate transport system substrate-binding protein
MELTRNRFGVFASVAAVAALTLAGCASATTEEAPAASTEQASTEADPRADWPNPLIVGAVPSEESSSLVQSYATLITALEEGLGVDVEFQQATEYAGIIEGMVSGRVHVAQFGPFSYVLAGYRGAELEVVGVMTDGPDIEPGYQSYGIARGDNDEINSIEDFAGKTVCFVDPASTSGFLYPSEGLLTAGIDPSETSTDITPVFAGGHDASVLAVKNGDCDAGFAFDAMVDSNLIESGDIEEGEIKTVWKSEVIAGSPMGMLASLPDDMKAEIQRIVLEEVNVDALTAAGVCASAEECGITDENVWGWVERGDDFFDGVRKVCEVTGSTKCQ